MDFFISGCVRYTKYEISPREKAVNKVMGKNSRLLAKKYHIRPFAVTVAMPEGNIQYLELKFQIYGPLSRDEIRKVLIDTVHDFLTDINSDTELCTYLKNHSLTIQEIGITLFVIDSTGRGLNDSHIGIASISKGELQYKITALKYDSVIKMDIPYFKSRHIEEYQEALDALKICDNFIASE